MQENKIRVLTISDSPVATSGVGRQMGLILDALVATGRFQILSLAGAIRHASYQPFHVDKWKNDVTIYPVDGFGTQDMIRSIMSTYRPDVVLLFTDPRFFFHVFSIDNEIRRNSSLIYYHVWDNLPMPHFNRPLYESNDHIACISQLTYDIVREVAPSVQSSYVPHVLDPELYKKLPDDEVVALREKHFPGSKDKTVFFWNNRNARRKLSGSLIFWFNEFLKKVGKDKAILMMHTDPIDENGQNLPYLINHFGLNNGEVVLSSQKVDDKTLVAMYNVADATINVSSAEGHGLSLGESLLCETPIIVNITGGMQSQVTDLSREEVEKINAEVLYGEHFFGVGIKPASKHVVGDVQVVPYIFDDYLCEKDVVHAFWYMMTLSKEQRNELGRRGREFIVKNFNFNEFNVKWVEILDSTIARNGRFGEKNKKNWRLKEIN